MGIFPKGGGGILYPISNNERLSTVDRSLLLCAKQTSALWKLPCFVTMVMISLIYNDPCFVAMMMSLNIFSDPFFVAMALMSLDMQCPVNRKVI